MATNSSLIPVIAFSYRPLVEPDAFRLLSLQPARDTSSQIHCILEHSLLSKYRHEIIEQFTALSYVWGDKNDKRIIILNNCPVTITSSLESAFHHLRDVSRVLCLWVDALCSNQCDLTEKTTQVQFMGSIYSTALHTFIYLSDSIDEIDIAFDTIRSVAHREDILLQSFNSIGEGLAVFRKSLFSGVLTLLHNTQPL
jgi:hypothetical protein